MKIMSNVTTVYVILCKNCKRSFLLFFFIVMHFWINFILNSHKCRNVCGEHKCFMKEHTILTFYIYPKVHYILLYFMTVQHWIIEWRVCVSQMHNPQATLYIYIPPWNFRPFVVILWFYSLLPTLDSEINFLRNWVDAISFHCFMVLPMR